MQSDIKLDGDQVIVEGNFLHAKALDFKLDSPLRRTSENGHRRALVHDFDDGLTINFESDYPGGVTIKGQTKVDDILLYGLAKIRYEGPPLFEDKQKSLLEELDPSSVHDIPDISDRFKDIGIDLQPGENTVPNNESSDSPGKFIMEPASLIGIIKELYAKMEKLEDKIAELEKNE